MNVKTALARTAWLGGLAAMLWLPLAGCGSGPPEPPKILRIWPEPPAEARVCLRRVIASSDDFKKPQPFADFLGLLAGQARQRIQQPQGVAVGPDDKLYVADQGLQGVHVFDLRAGRFSFIDRVSKEQYLVSPVGVAVCGDLLAISDSSLNKVFLLDGKGNLVRTIDKPGGFARPTGLACDPARGELYVVDTVADEVCVFNFAGDLLRRFGDPGRGPGEFNLPTHVFVTRDGRVYVSDSLNFRVQAFDRAGAFQTAFGKLGDATGHMAMPKGLGVDELGHVYVADSTLAAVQVFDPEGQFLLAFGERGSGPGSFEMPGGVAVRGNMIYVCDFYGGRVQVFEYIGKEDEQQTTE